MVLPISLSTFKPKRGADSIAAIFALGFNLVMKDLLKTFTVKPITIRSGETVLVDGEITRKLGFVFGNCVACSSEKGGV